MKKYLQIGIVLAVFLVAVLLRDLHSGGGKIAAAARGDAQTGSAFSVPAHTTPNPSDTGASTATATPSAPSPTPWTGGVASTPTQSTPLLSSTPTPQRAGQYKDGSYTGPQADAYYGYVQVQAVVANGRLVDVKFLQYPNHARTSQMINAQVMPWLTQEAIQAQSARIDIISGASATSEAFAQSLNSALAQAR